MYVCFLEWYICLDNKNMFSREQQFIHFFLQNFELYQGCNQMFSFSEGKNLTTGLWKTYIDQQIIFISDNMHPLLSLCCVQVWIIF